MDPNDPNIVVAGSILDNVYHSQDAGKTWQKDKLTSPLGVFGDPCVVASPKGDFYFLHLSDPEGKGWKSDALLDRIVCQRSKNGGQTWSKGGGMGHTPPKDQDKEWAVVNADGSRIHACWTQFDVYGSKEPGDSTTILCSFANARGKQWSEPVRVSDVAGDCLDGDDTAEGAVPAVGVNGEIFVAWLVVLDLLDKSLDGGQTWGEDRIVADIAGGWDQSILRQTGNACPSRASTRARTAPGPDLHQLDRRWAHRQTDDTDDAGATWSTTKRVNTTVQTETNSSLG